MTVTDLIIDATERINFMTIGTNALYDCRMAFVEIRTTFGRYFSCGDKAKADECKEYRPYDGCSGLKGFVGFGFPEPVCLIPVWGFER